MKNNGGLLHLNVLNRFNPLGTMNVWCDFSLLTFKKQDVEVHATHEEADCGNFFISTHVDAKVLHNSVEKPSS